MCYFSIFFDWVNLKRDQNIYQHMNDDPNDLLTYLNQTGANPNNHYLVDTLCTPLEAAIERKSVSLVKVLLEHGADPNLYSWMNRAPIYRVHPEDDIYKLLILHGAELNGDDTDF